MSQEIEEHTGVAQLNAFLRTVTDPLREILSSVNSSPVTININKIFQPGNYQHSRVRKLPQIFDPLGNENPADAYFDNKDIFATMLPWDEHFRVDVFSCNGDVFSNDS